MKKIIFYSLAVVVCAACGQKSAVHEKIAPDEKWAIMQEHYMVPGAPVGSERPLPNVLSEQEVLLKAADAAIKEGVLDSSYPEYQENPALMTAKIETPILVTDAQTGEPGWYLLMAVDSEGVLLARVGFNSDVNASDTEFVGIRAFAFPGSQDHFITKREAAELIQSQFPDKNVSEPMAISNLRLEDERHSNMFAYWYFTVSDESRSATDSADEYVMGTTIHGYTSIPGGVTNRAAIDYAGQRGDRHLKGYRMAKLNKPLGLFKKLEAARAAGGTGFTPTINSFEDIGITPAPLK
jgi:hypothetical protein